MANFWQADFWAVDFWVEPLSPFWVDDFGGGPTTPPLDTIEDAIFAVTGMQVNDGMASHFGKTANEHLHDAERRWLIGQGATPGGLEDMWIEVHGPGEINAVKLAYWNSQRP